MVGERFISRPFGENRLWHLFILHRGNGMKKPQKPWRLLGFCDRHLFRSLNVVAEVGFFIARPSRIVLCRRLRTLGSAHSLLCGVSRHKNSTPCCFCLLTHSLRRRKAAAKVAMQVAPREQQKNRPPEWVVCSFVGCGGGI
jgi:hypothetical protein